MKNLKSNFVAPYFFVIAISLALIGPLTRPAGSAQFRRAAAGTVYEGEALVSAARASEGRLVSQPMASFGTAWSGGAQLLWAPGRIGADLVITVSVPAADHYSIAGDFTKAPDYGVFSLLVNGAAVGAPFDGYDARVIHSGRVVLGTAQLAAGNNSLVFQIAGKSARSAGFLVGIDRIELTPTGRAMQLAPEVAVVSPGAASVVTMPPRAIMRRKFTAVLPYYIAFRPLPRSPTIDIKFPVTWKDLRPIIKQKGIQIRDQGNRGTCSIFATTFLFEYLYATQKNWNFQDLSEEYLNYATNLTTGNKQDGDFFSNIDLGYQKWGTYPEALVPYQPVYNSKYVVPNVYMDVGKKWYRFTPDFIKPWDNTKGATPAQIDEVIAYIDQGIPVALGCYWPLAGKAVTMQYMSNIDVMVAPPKYDVTDGHSVAIVGYWKHSGYPGGGFFIFRNSWGAATFGDQGYGYMSFDYVLKYANDLLAYHS